MSSKARASFLFRDTIKLLGEFKLRHPHTRILQICSFFFFYSLCLKHFSYFKIDRFIYLFIQFVFYPPPVKNTFRINLKFTIEPAPTHFSISAYFTNTHFIFRTKMKFSREKCPYEAIIYFYKSVFRFFFNGICISETFYSSKEEFQMRSDTQKKKRPEKLHILYYQN